MTLDTLADLDHGTVHVVVGDAAALRQEINELGAKVNGRAFALLSMPGDIDSAALGPRLTSDLARIALRLWPDWYDTTLDVPREDSDAVALSALDAIAIQAGRRHHGVNLSWLQRAARAVHESRLPLTQDIAPSVQIAQLAKVISPTGLVLLLEGPWHTRPDSDVLARQIENSARASGLTLILLCGEGPLDAAFARFPHIAASTREVGPPAEVTGPAFGPVIGRPHPNSEAEQRLYDYIATTQDLSSLFHWNQVIQLSPAATPKVDLIWPQGRLVVEIDGWVDHSTREKFESDRLRDYELLAAGYVVFRVSNSEVLEDTERVIAKLRRIVAVLSDKRE